jgi:carbohydrate kinase (thermoresistant glucokinase family)
MGVAGVGKTTVGRRVADELRLPFHDADDFHTEESRRKMAAGVPLSEEDREPWLRDLAGRIGDWEREGGAVLACSALRRAHRELLAGGAPGSVAFVFLDADPATIRARLATRAGHYMPATLLESQLETLEPPGPDEALHVSADGGIEETAAAVVGALRDYSRSSASSP